MPNYSWNIVGGLIAGFACYVGLSVFVVKVENDYRRAFTLPLTTWKANLVSLLIGATCIAILARLSSDRIPVTAGIAFWLAGASLVGIWRIDRKMLVIPDRLQILGLGSGCLYMGALVQSGESPAGVFLELGFALAMVALLWLISVLYEKVRGRIGFGFGDTKLLGWLSFFVGKRMANLVFLAVAIGILTVLLHIIRKRMREGKWTLPQGQDAFAFGPSIVLAVFIEGVLNYA